MRGRVKFFNSRQRYGFIVPDDGSANVYFPEESLPRGRRWDPVEGDVVEFDTREASKGRMALHIQLEPATDGTKYPESEMAQRMNGGGS